MTGPGITPPGLAELEIVIGADGSLVLSAGGGHDLPVPHLIMLLSDTRSLRLLDRDGQLLAEAHIAQPELWRDFSADLTEATYLRFDNGQLVDGHAVPVVLAGEAQPYH